MAYPLLSFHVAVSSGSEGSLPTTTNCQARQIWRYAVGFCFAYRVMQANAKSDHNEQLLHRYIRDFFFSIYSSGVWLKHLLCSCKMACCVKLRERPLLDWHNNTPFASQPPDINLIEHVLVIQYYDIPESSLLVEIYHIVCACRVGEHST